MKRILILAFAILICFPGRSFPQARAPSAAYERAEYVFNTQLDLKTKIDVQIDLIASGYLNSVPLDSFEPRVFEAVKRFQREHGLLETGIVDPGVRALLLSQSTAMFRAWGFTYLSHPLRGRPIWAPTGMGLSPKPNKNGVGYADPDGKISFNYNHFPGRTIGETFDALLDAYGRGNVKIHYKARTTDQFVLSTTSALGTDGYLRYYADGPGITGFALFWSNDKGNVSGERIAVLMSASLRAAMTGAPFLLPPRLQEPQVASNQSSPPVSPPRYEARAPTPADTPATPRGFVSAGTGFFVSPDGLIVTNAHVVDECRTVQVTTEDRRVHAAQVIARDKTNDLALLRTAARVARVATMRLSARMGEGVAAFGFPHSDMLATTGNFTLGNVTATSGMEDDSRFYQISAPVQSGNSGGPLLDERGNVVGMVTAKLNAIKVALQVGDLPQNVNFALKSSLVAGFLSTNNVEVQSPNNQGDRLQPADIADIARRISAFVTCR